MGIIAHLMCRITGNLEKPRQKTPGPPGVRLAQPRGEHSCQDANISRDWLRSIRSLADSTGSAAAELSSPPRQTAHLLGWGTLQVIFGLTPV
jgi:hypothetical protein